MELNNSTMTNAMDTQTAGAAENVPAAETAGQDSGQNASVEAEQDGRISDNQDPQAEADGGARQEKPWHTDENAANAQRRREAQARQRERMFREMTDGINDPRTGQPFANEEAWRQWKQSAAIRARAQAAGVEPEKAQQIVEGMRDTLRETDPEYQRLRAEAEAARNERFARTFERDLAAIKKAYPDEKAKNVAELGPEFMAIMASGQVSAVAAYEAVRAQHNRMAPKPPSTGAIGGTAGRKDGYYTRDEVAAMSRQQVHEHFEDIQKSMRQWK